MTKRAKKRERVIVLGCDATKSRVSRGSEFFYFWVRTPLGQVQLHQSGPEGLWTAYWWPPKVRGRGITLAVAGTIQALVSETNRRLYRIHGACAEASAEEVYRGC